MRTRSVQATIKALPSRRHPVAANEDFNRRAWRTALLTFGLLAALIFGIIVLAGGDWVPGAIIVAASLVGLTSQIPIIARLCKGPPPAH
jgi:hypothetical protein